MKYTFATPIAPRFVSLSGLIIAGLLSSAALAVDPAPPAPAATVPTTPTLVLTNVDVAAPKPNAQPQAGHVGPRVEVFAFTPVNKVDPADWIGRGIQENLQSDISKTGATLVLPPHQAAATDDPMEAARRDHADLAVVGTYQIVGDQVRVNAHLMDVTSNTAAGGFSATGAQRDLFQLEDALGEQLRRLLPRATVAAQPVQSTAQPDQSQQPVPTVSYAQPAPTVIYQEAPQTTYAPPAYYESGLSYYPDYSYPYYNGYYGYPFGFYGGIGIYSGGYRGGYYHGNGFSNGFGHTLGHAGVGGGIHVGGGGVHGGGGFHGGGGHR